MRVVAGLFTLSTLLGATSVAYAASAAQTLVDLETKWSQAIVAKDTATVTAIVAPTWTAQGPSGSETFAEMIADLKSGKSVSTAVTNHDVHVQIYGTIAVVQGADTETSFYAGKDTSGEYTWTDVYKKTHGTWMAVASQATKLAKP